MRHLMQLLAFRANPSAFLDGVDQCLTKRRSPASDATQRTTDLLNVMVPKKTVKPESRADKRTGILGAFDRSLDFLAQGGALDLICPIHSPQDGTLVEASS